MIPNNNNNYNDEVANDENEGPLKKGPWTPDEDAILSAYVKRFGEGNWNLVQRNSGLSRCGKSCRLRWANHLRPNLKKGTFSEEEERIVVDLHAKIGNKWSQMATQLPGRTDNEIKNFWNTRLKRCQRESLPIYPLAVLREAALYHKLEQQYYEQQTYNMPPLSVLSRLYPNSKPNVSNYYSAAAVNPAPLQNQLLDSGSNFYTIPSLNLPSPPISLFAGSLSSNSSDVFNNNNQSLSFGATAAHHGFAAGGGTDSLFDFQYSGSLSFNHGINNNGDSMIPPLIQSSGGSSSQSLPDSSLTPVSSHNSGGVDGFMGASSMVSNEFFEVAPFSSPQGNSGLLDAVLLGGQSLSERNKPRSEDSTSAAARTTSRKRKSMVVEENAEGNTSVVPVAVESALMNTGETSRSPDDENIDIDKLLDAIEPHIFDKTISWDEPDDDLPSLLDDFPLEMPLSDWYQGVEIQSPGIETQPHAPPPSGPTDEVSMTFWNLLEQHG
ncbi:hypothetical protein RIF29_27414 [Crotalaria pallida]|uniref:Uncharacterized protein n=1 Tax=Crotalaria pallida TaxID=3830 RepID=A0AAN9ER81_CROPI